MRHLYIHVPFCARRCSYCDFAIAVRKLVPSESFAGAVVAEWRSWLGSPWWADSGPIETIYFGGGTPSLLAPDSLGAIIAAIRSDRIVASDCEITIEANPEDVTAERAARWRAAGINRVSLGVQSFDPSVLEWMHRSHGPDRPGVAVRELRAAGIANVSVDLIYATPDHLGRDWTADLDRALGLEPSHLSLYGLTIEERTPLGRWVDRGAVVPASEGRAADEYLEAHQRLTAAGLHHYEVSNAGRPGFESRHNRAYWRRAPYLGLGPSAHSASGNRRWWNRRDWAAYQAAIEGGRSAVEDEETLVAEQIALEQRYLGLRTTAGLPVHALPPAELAALEAAGWARRVEGRVVLTPEGWLRLDAIVASLPAQSLP